MLAQLMRCVRPVIFVELPLLVVLDEVVRFAAAVDDSGWWPPELSVYHRDRQTRHPSRLDMGPGYRVAQT